MAVKMTHPDTKRTITVRTDAVDIYRTQGWRVVEAKPAKKK